VFDEAVVEIVAGLLVPAGGEVEFADEDADGGEEAPVFSLVGEFEEGADAIVVSLGEEEEPAEAEEGLEGGIAADVFSEFPKFDAEGPAGVFVFRSGGERIWRRGGRRRRGVRSWRRFQEIIHFPQASQFSVQLLDFQGGGLEAFFIFHRQGGEFPERLVLLFQFRGEFFSVFSEGIPEARVEMLVDVLVDAVELLEEGFVPGLQVRVFQFGGLEPADGCAEGRQFGFEGHHHVDGGGEGEHLVRRRGAPGCFRRFRRSGRRGVVVAGVCRAGVVTAGGNSLRRSVEVLVQFGREVEDEGLLDVESLCGVGEFCEEGESGFVGGGEGVAWSGVAASDGEGIRGRRFGVRRRGWFIVEPG